MRGKKLCLLINMVKKKEIPIYYVCDDRQRGECGNFDITATVKLNKKAFNFRFFSKFPLIHF